jgi:hypothetical protein
VKEDIGGIIIAESREVGAVEGGKIGFEPGA